MSETPCIQVQISNVTETPFQVCVTHNPPEGCGTFSEPVPDLHYDGWQDVDWESLKVLTDRVTAVLMLHQQDAEGFCTCCHDGDDPDGYPQGYWVDYPCATVRLLTGGQA